MDQVVINSTTIGIVISVLGYELGMLLKRKFKLAVFNPLLISIIFVIINKKIQLLLGVKKSPIK